MNSKMDLFLCNLLNKPKFLEFSVPELVSLASLHKVSCVSLFSHYKLSFSSDLEFSTHFTSMISEFPFLFVYLPDCTIASSIIERGVCVHNFTKTLSQGNSIEELVNSFPQENLEILAEDTPFAFTFNTYRTKLSLADKDRMILSFRNLPFKGCVDLKNPTRKFTVTICQGQYFFGLEVSSKSENRRFYSKYSLSSREYLGPTSTDTELSFLMANQGQLTKDSLVLDPFVGTGSTLIAAAHFSALCFGGDLDIRVLKGYKVGRSQHNTHADIFTNFANYNLAQPEILRMDNSRSVLRRTEVFDAIVCDPPYGIRARSRKSTKIGINSCVRTEQYEGEGVMRDLLELAAGLLRPGGRLVYLLPCERLRYSPEDIPCHPLLLLIGNSENVLTGKVSRRLITMEKVVSPQAVLGPCTSSFYTGLRGTWFSS